MTGDLIAAEKRIVQLRADLENIDGALRVFDPSSTPQKIRPIHRRRSTVGFRHGECARAILSLLRQTDAPMTVREIAERLAVEHRLDTGAAAMASLIIKVRGALGRQRAGTIESGKRGEAVTWQVARHADTLARCQ
jgi:hypothetical protein